MLILDIYSILSKYLNEVRISGEIGVNVSYQFPNGIFNFGRCGSILLSSTNLGTTAYLHFSDT
jgi:hypothetical protein